MNGKIRRLVLLSVALTALACSAPLQAFSFCFSFSNDSHRSSPYSRYVPPYPLLPGAYYPAGPGQLLPPASAYTPVYPLPPLQPYEELMPAQPGW
jgi:hypothetical protein